MNDADQERRTAGRPTPELTAAAHAGGHRVRLRFADGVSGTVDVAGELHGEMFEALRNPELFAQLVLDTELGTVRWPNGADLSPAWLYDRVERDRVAEERKTIETAREADEEHEARSAAVANGLWRLLKALTA